MVSSADEESDKLLDTVNFSQEKVSDELARRKAKYGLGIHVFRRFWTLMKVVNSSTPSYVIFLVLVALLEQYVIYNVGIITSEYYRVLGGKNWTGFWQQTIKAVSFIVAISLIKSSKEYIISILYAVWRQVLTQELHRKYFAHNNFYSLSVLTQSIDNPDQRIAQDVDKFCNEMSTILPLLFVSPFTIGYYSYVSYTTTGWIGPFGITCFFLISAVINRFLMTPIVSLIFLQEQREGFFRFKHMHTRVNAESIALQNGTSAELSYTSNKLFNLVNVQQILFGKQFLLNIAVKFSDYIGSIISFFILAFPVFSGRYDYLSVEDLSALISKNAFVSIYLISCFSQLVDTSASFSRIAGYTHRISELLEYLDKHLQKAAESSLISHSFERNIQSETVESGDTLLKVSNLTFYAPGGKQPLMNGFSLHITRGKNILVKGSSSSGKTSLLRVITGLWPATQGDIKFNLPIIPSCVFVLPQKPLMTDGSLREQIVYPLEVSDCAVFPGDDDDLIISYLQLVDLSHILDKMENLDSHVNWNWYDVLSPGEAQRLSFVRLYYHRPILAFLDEATSAVGQDMEEKLYLQCQALGITIMSIGHRNSLNKYHKITVVLDGKGNWKHE